jgi:uncharacterized tellurite resistance protein B-like protein
MNDQDTHEYGRQMVALLRRLTETDGDVSVLEKRWVRTLMQELPGANDENVACSGDFDPNRLKELVQEEGEAEELIELLLLISLADGQTSPAEWKLISDIAKLVGISPDHLETMRATTVLTVEPT